MSPPVTFALVSFQFSCFIYRSQVVKPSEKWSVYIKIELNQRFLDLRNRFHIGDYQGFRKKG